MPATYDRHPTATATPTLYLALELGATTWNLAATTAIAQKPRLRTIAARDPDGLHREIQHAKGRFALPPEAPVAACYEAGRDGLGIQRHLAARGMTCRVVDAPSIAVDRRARRAESDGLDATRLLTLLIRYRDGEPAAWSVVCPPAPEDEDRRRGHRERIALTHERTEHSNRILGPLASPGPVAVVDATLPRQLDAVRQGDGTPLPAELKARLGRELVRWQLVDDQIRQLENRLRRQLRDATTPQVEEARRLLDLKGIGPIGARLPVCEVFGWRPIKNRRERAGLMGLTPTPYQGGTSHREQGIGRAGNRRVRWRMVELARMWLRYQPASALSRWYRLRFGAGNARARKVGIVASARELVVALRRYVEGGEAPAGAVLVPWQKELNGRPRAGRAPDLVLT